MMENIAHPGSSRASDYSLFRDDKGVFHVVPHDMNEAFRPPGGPGMGGPGGRPNGPGGRPGNAQLPGGGPPPAGGPPGGGRPNGPGGRPQGVALDPLVGLDDARKPLRSKVLAVPTWREKYLQHVRTIAAESLDWKALGPVVGGFRTLIEKDVEADTRKLTPTADFLKLTADEAPPAGEAAGGRRPEGMSLRAFADQRRAYLLNYSEAKIAQP